MDYKNVIVGIVGVIVAALVGIYVYIYALEDIITNNLTGVANSLMSGLFVVMFFLAISLLPITVLYKAIQSK
jgi:hypothetical protein